MLQLSLSSILAAAIWSDTNATGGLWRHGTNWAGGSAPRLSLGSTYLTNRISKTVILDAGTPITNLFINSLNIWGAPGVTNTLLLQDAGTNSPLVVSNQTVTIANRGALRITNSSLVVTGNFINFNLVAGDVILDSGLLLVREEPVTSNITVVTRIGRTNTANMILNGGEMQATKVLVGETANPGILHSLGTIQMNGGRLSVTAELSVGDGLGCTGLVQMIGGEIVVANQGTNISRLGDQGRGEATISNALFSIGNLSVGRHAEGIGILTVQNGGVYLGSDDLNIGRFSGATGLVQVAGGTLTVSNNPIWVGREGQGSLIVSNGLLVTEMIRVAAELTNTATGSFTMAGGMALVSSGLVIGDGIFSNATVSVYGGALLVTNRTGDASLELKSGTMTLNGGTITADRIVMTNGAGQMLFNGGELHSRATLVQNGAPFVIGDGVRPATLVLEGGAHIFADGLIIAPNATVSGCGTITGNIVNNGTLLATNCPGGTPAPVIVLTALIGSELVFSFPSAAGVSYAVEFKDTLNDPLWQPFDTVAGNGGTLSITNALTSSPTRFFRLRVE